MITLWCLLTIAAIIAFVKYKRSKLSWYQIEGWKEHVIMLWVIITAIFGILLIVIYLP